MHVTFTPWVNHSGGAIYSLDMSPTQDKLATCGQGEVGGEGLIIIWNLLAMTDEKHGKNIENENPTLARIQQQGGVNSVRWSRCGQFLAAASDDKTVTVWEYSGRIKSAGTIGRGKGDANLEKYRCLHTMHSHSMEVLAVEWSWDGRYLASASIDNTVIVWDAKRLPERLVVLDAKREGHTGPVKGISFDPIGKYLATQSGDKTLKLWSMDNWTCETTITKPFEESAQSTLFSRPEWSPDGRLLIAPCAMNNGGPTAQIVKRGSWDTNLDMVGHRKAVTCVRTAQFIYDYTDYKGKKSKVSIVAVGSRDKGISVWALPLLSRPIVHLSRFFRHSVTDMSWKDYTLISSSQDGSVKTFTFSKKDIGVRLRSEEMSEICYSLYRCRPVQYSSTGMDNGDSPNKLFIDTPAELIASRMVTEKKKEEKETKDKEREEAERRAKQEKELVEKRKTQIEAVTKDGKRRIQPIFICSTIDTSVPEKEKEKEEEKKGEERMEIDGDNERIEDTTKTTNEKRQTKAHQQISSVSFPKKKDEKEKKESTLSSSYSTCSTEGSSQLAMEKNRTKREALLIADFHRPTLRSIESLPVSIDHSSVSLPSPPPQPYISEPVQGMKGMWIGVENEWTSSGVRATRVCLVRKETVEDKEKERIQWTAFISSPVLIMAANSRIVGVACSDCCLVVINLSSGSIAFSLLLDSLPSVIGVQLSRVFILTSNGLFSCWETSKEEAILCRLPIVDCVTKKAALNSVSLSPCATPILCFSNGSSYGYSTKLKSWYMIDSCTNVSRLNKGISQEELGDGPIAKILAKRRRPPIAPSIPLSARSLAAESETESLLFAAFQSSSFSDLSPLLIHYTSLLINHKSMKKLEEILEKVEKIVEEKKGSKEGLKLGNTLKEMTTLSLTLLKDGEANEETVDILEDTIIRHVLKKLGPFYYRIVTMETAFEGPRYKTPASSITKLIVEQQGERSEKKKKRTEDEKEQIKMGTVTVAVEVFEENGESESTVLSVPTNYVVRDLLPKIDGVHVVYVRNVIGPTVKRAQILRVPVTEIEKLVVERRKELLAQKKLLTTRTKLRNKKKNEKIGNGKMKREEKIEEKRNERKEEETKGVEEGKRREEQAEKRKRKRKGKGVKKDGDGERGEERNEEIKREEWTMDDIVQGMEELKTSEETNTVEMEIEEGTVDGRTIGVEDTVDKGERNVEITVVVEKKKKKKKKEKEEEVDEVDYSKYEGTIESTVEQLLNTQIIAFYEESRLDETETKEQEKVMALLPPLIQSIFQEEGVTLDLFGSSVSGFGTKNSDMDVCLRMTGELEEKNKEMIRQAELQRSIVRKLSRVIRKEAKEKGYYDIQAIPFAKVPIVQFSMKLPKGRSVQVDISVYNELPIYNTRLLRKYCQCLSPGQLTTLGIFVKHWAKSCDIGDASKGSLSSYAYIIMLIHFLQRTEPPLLPFLQEMGEKREEIVMGHNVYFFDGPFTITPNSLNSAQLFFRFLQFYATFDWKEQVVQIRTSEIVKKEDTKWKNSLMVIQDPFDLDHNLSKRVGKWVFHNIDGAFKRSTLFFLNDALNSPSNAFSLLMKKMTEEARREKQKRLKESREKLKKKMEMKRKEEEKNMRGKGSGGEKKGGEEGGKGVDRNGEGKGKKEEKKNRQNSEKRKGQLRRAIERSREERENTPSLITLCTRKHSNKNKA